MWPACAACTCTSLTHGARAEKSGFNITLRRDLDPAAGMIDLYPQEITRVFFNLISNGFYAATKRKEAGDDSFEPTLSATTKSLGNNASSPRTLVPVLVELFGDDL